ncbi:hypothetical protein R3P38DRAFT_477622 [Favolaschia claudopus]|uniref:F-box domain-containing protein n=1 Tax=Favolaschia claudopus TaxID=2862362 RepID=A0AAW0CJS3_9AGAR
MSAEILRTQIAELDKIERVFQEIVLKKLNIDRTHLRRQLNALHDPIARLPLEISSQIFLYTLEPSDSEFHNPAPIATHAPMLLLNICHAWSDITLSTPALWTTIHVSFPCTNGMNDSLLLPWLERAGSRPLSLSVDGPFHDASSIIWRRPDRLKCLKFHVGIEAETGKSTVEIWWESLEERDFPTLETLIICGPPSTNDSLHMSTLVEFLSSAPNLVELVMKDASDVEPAPLSLALPNLRRLQFGDWREFKDIDASLIDALTCSQLESLTVPMYDFGWSGRSAEMVHNFLTRSAPPLKEFVAGVAHGKTLDWSTLLKSLTLAPTLLRLEIWCISCGQAEEILENLAASLSLLPNLTSIVLHRNHRELDRFPDSFFTQLSATFIARRRLHSFSFKLHAWRTDLSLVPAPNILAPLQELVANGRHLDITNVLGSFPFNS